MHKLFATLFLIPVLGSCFQPAKVIDPKKAKLDSVCNQFMKEFSDGKIHNAYELLKSNSILDVSSLDTLDQHSRQQLNDALPVYGKMTSFEFIRETKINNFLAKRYYILKFEKYYLKFAFTLYNNGSNWTISHFDYNDELLELGL